MPIDQRIDGILGLLREEFEKGASASREVEYLQGQIRAQVCIPLFLKMYQFERKCTSAVNYMNDLNCVDRLS